MTTNDPPRDTLPHTFEPMPDYSQFIQVAESRQIRWPLSIAIRLGAGYVPNPTDNTVLIASSNRVKANERTLFAAVRVPIDDMSPPPIFERDGEGFVAAKAFLLWLAKYILISKSDISFPADLARAVSNAESSAHGGRQYVHLSDALEPYFDVDFADLPSALQAATIEALSPFNWDEFGPTRRRQQIHNSELNNDPARRGESEFWWQFVVKKQGLEKSIATWEAISATSANELAEKDDRLRVLAKDLAGLEGKMASIRELLPSERQASARAEDAGKHSYVPYPDAFNRLNMRHATTPEEIAAWLFIGAKNGGLSAYTNANELDPPPTFNFGYGDDFDYLGQMMSTWFRVDDIESFEPQSRFVSGAALFDRWRDKPGIQVEAFIRAKVFESRLSDIHPISGMTQWSHPNDLTHPPLISALFNLAEVVAIESEDFGQLASDGELTEAKSEAVPAWRIMQSFTVKATEIENMRWWNSKMRNAARYDLSDCRAAMGQGGIPNSSMWYPDRLAGWLIDKRHLSALTAARMLKANFADCVDIAEQLQEGG